MATKYKCPYCDHMRMTKDELIGHIDEEHREMIPEGWSAGRLAFKIIYKKDHGTCVVCKRPTEWNDKRCKYQRLCGDPNCRKALRDAALKNHIKVYKCKTLLNSPIHQEKMLRNRKISGEYKFRDGGKIGYVGSYEKNFLEFMDKSLDVKSDEIIEPGPVFEYDMEGKKHFWITDFLYIPYNLVIEVKDGGDNPNKRNMPMYRKKEAMKDKLITEKGTYNYLKLTNNNFAQLLEIFAVMRMQMMNDEPENRRVVIRVNEDTDLLNEAVDSKYTRSYKNLDEFCKYIKSPQEVSNWFFVNKVRWPYDNWVNFHRRHLPKIIRNEWDDSRGLSITWPDEILRTKTAICFDHAVFMHYCCERYGYKNELLSIHIIFSHPIYGTIMVGHCVCVYEIPKEGWFIFNYFDDYNSNPGPFNSLQESIKAYQNIYVDMVQGLEKGFRKYKIKPILKQVNTYIFNDKDSKWLDDYYNKQPIFQGDFAIQSEGFLKWMKTADTANPGRLYWIEEMIVDSKLANKIKNPINRLKNFLKENASLLNEASSNKRFCLPLDPKGLKNGQYFVCANTHVPNVALQTVQLSAFFSAIVSLIWGVAFIPQLIFALKFTTMINAATITDQIFARDFMILDKDSVDNFSDRLLNYPIRSVDDGQVVEVKKYQMPYGNCVIIKHSDCYSLYAHIIEGGIKVREGQKIKRGQVIGLCGSTGNSSAPHLHFEMTLTKPGGAITAVPKLLTDFERFNCKEFSVGDIYIDGYKDPDNFIKKLYDNASKGNYKTSNGDIPSFCFIKK